MIILLAIFATATICIPIAVTYGRMIESHRWADRVREAKAENRQLRSFVRAAERLICQHPASTGMEVSRAEMELAIALDELMPGEVEDLERLVG